MKREKAAIAGMAGLFVLVGVVIGVQAAYKAGFSNSEDAGEKARWNDLRVFYGAGRIVFQDVNLYTTPVSPEGRYYIYPPFLAAACAAPAALGWRPFVIMWVAGSLAALGAAALMCAKTVRPGAKGAGLVALGLLSLALCARPVLCDFQNGQANCLTFFFTAASLLLFVKRRDAASGLVMAIAASMKMTAAIFLPYFLFKGAYRVAAGMVLGLVFTLVLLPMLAFGPARAARLYSSLYDKMVEPFASVTDAPHVYSEAGQSLRAAANRYLSDTDAAHHAPYEVKVNFVNLSPDAVWKIVLAGCAALAAASAFCARANPADESRRHLIALELGAVLLLMLVVSPVTRKAHFVGLLLPCCACANYVLLFKRDSRRGLSRAVLLAATLAAFALFNLTSPGIVGREASVFLQALSIFFFAAIVLWAAICFVLVRDARIPRESLRERGS